MFNEDALEAISVNLITSLSSSPSEILYENGSHCFDASTSAEGLSSYPVSSPEIRSRSYSQHWKFLLHKIQRLKQHTGSLERESEREKETFHRGLNE